MVVGNEHQRGYPSHRERDRSLDSQVPLPFHVCASSDLRYLCLYTCVTVDNSHQGGYPSHRDDSHRASAMCMSLAGTHRVFCSNHDLVKPLVSIYIQGMNPLCRLSRGACDNYLSPPPPPPFWLHHHLGRNLGT